ncbi:MAG: hypothetical protein U0746_10875 [Gemmataceae bacterium]
MTLRTARVCAMILAATSIIRISDMLNVDTIVGLVQASTETTVVLVRGSDAAPTLP